MLKCNFLDILQKRQLYIFETFSFILKTVNIFILY